MNNKPSYIIKILNSTSDDAKFVVIGHSYCSRFEKNYGHEPNIKITSLVPGVSYNEFLGSTEKQPFWVVKTIIKSSTTGQLNQPVSIIHPLGRKSTKNTFWINKQWITTRKLKEHPITLRRKDQLSIKYKFLFDGEAKIWFESIVGKATVLIYLFTN